MNPTLRVHHLCESSRSNGPGDRAVLWLQGCTFACPGCYNPQTHSLQGGRPVEIVSLLDWFLGLTKTGLTISGGEPMLQAEPLNMFLSLIRVNLPDASILLFSGFTRAEICADPQKESVARCCDVLITGRYQAEQRLAHSLLGSANKEIHCLTSRHTPEEIAQTPVSEILIDSEGNITLTGIDPLKW
ncbi:MAG TPA: 4Fe-4S single cluster domain-containing protein [Anaerolineaceae bacterium]|nr:4Fe-4S single cluster domain-containing protein [Anaerolineaceae bacterium]HPN50895.1 4Fe-4S single cluster domain-containing protein [Anaerolineaceae bacterium]